MDKSGLVDAPFLTQNFRILLHVGPMLSGNNLLAIIVRTGGELKRRIDFVDWLVGSHRYRHSVPDLTDRSQQRQCIRGRRHGGCKLSYSENNIHITWQGNSILLFLICIYTAIVPRMIFFLKFISFFYFFFVKFY